LLHRRYWFKNWVSSKSGSPSVSSATPPTVLHYWSNLWGCRR